MGGCCGAMKSSHKSMPEKDKQPQSKNNTLTRKEQADGKHKKAEMNGKSKKKVEQKLEELNKTDTSADTAEDTLNVPTINQNATIGDARVATTEATTKTDVLVPAEKLYNPFEDETIEACKSEVVHEVQTVKSEVQCTEDKLENFSAQMNAKLESIVVPEIKEELIAKSSGIEVQAAAPCIADDKMEPGLSNKIEATKAVPIEVPHSQPVTGEACQPGVKPINVQVDTKHTESVEPETPSVEMVQPLQSESPEKKSVDISSEIAIQQNKEIAAVFEACVNSTPVSQSEVTIDSFVKPLQPEENVIELPQVTQNIGAVDTYTVASDEQPQPTVELSQPTAELFQPTAELSQPTAELSQPTAELSQLTTELSQPAAELSQPIAELSQPTAELSQPTAELSQLTTELSQPAAELSQPIAELSHPTAELSQPTAELSQLTTELSQPAAELSQPATELSQPAAELSQPTAELSQLTAELSQPTAELSQPADELSQPAAELSQPIAELSQPIAELSQPPLLIEEVSIQPTSLEHTIETDPILSTPSVVQQNEISKSEQVVKCQEEKLENVSCIMESTVCDLTPPTEPIEISQTKTLETVPCNAEPDVDISICPVQPTVLEATSPEPSEIVSEPPELPTSLPPPLDIDSVEILENEVVELVCTQKENVVLESSENIQENSAQEEQPQSEKVTVTSGEPCSAVDSVQPEQANSVACQSILNEDCQLETTKCVEIIQEEEPIEHVSKEVEVPTVESATEQTQECEITSNTSELNERTANLELSVDLLSEKIENFSKQLLQETVDGLLAEMASGQHGESAGEIKVESISKIDQVQSNSGEQECHDMMSDCNQLPVTSHSKIIEEKSTLETTGEISQDQRNQWWSQDAAAKEMKMDAIARDAANDSSVEVQQVDEPEMLPPPPTLDDLVLTEVTMPTEGSEPSTSEDSLPLPSPPEVAQIEETFAAVPCVENGCELIKNEIRGSVTSEKNAPVTEIVVEPSSESRLISVNDNASTEVAK